LQGKNPYKNHKFDQILNYGGLCTNPLHPSEPNLARGSKPMIYSSTLNSILISTYCHLWVTITLVMWRLSRSR